MKPGGYVEAAKRYMRDVLSGRVPACRWVRLACERQARDLKAQRIAAFAFRFFFIRVVVSERDQEAATFVPGHANRLAAAELEDSGFAEIRVLDGGTAAWRAAGLPLTTGREAMADTPDDCWRRPYDPYAPPDARERYLRWEIELIRQIEREGDTGFRVSA